MYIQYSTVALRAGKILFLILDIIIPIYLRAVRLYSYCTCTVTRLFVLPGYPGTRYRL